MRKTISIVFLLIMVFGCIPVTAASNNNLVINLDANKVKLNNHTTLRGVVSQGENPVSNEDATIKILDSKDKVVYADQMKTDKDGKFDVKVNVSESYYAKGDYRIYVTAMDVKENISFTVNTDDGDTGGSGGPSGGGGGGSKPEEPQGTNKLVASEKVSSKGATVKAENGNVELVFPKGTFEQEADVSIELVDKKEIIEPNKVSSLERVADVYEFNSSISKFKNKVEVTLKYDKDKLKGKNEELLGIYTFNEVANTWDYVGGKVDINKGTIKIKLEHFSKYTVMLSNKTFNDIKNYDWAKNAIEVMASKKIINGRGEGIFDPAQNITRAEFATLITKMMGYSTENMNVPFTDVNKEAWYYNYVGAAYQNGLINGRSETVFDPNGKITRQEMAVIAAKVLEQEGYAKVSLDKLNIFNDKGNIASWAKSSVSLCVNENIISGMGNGMFAPTQNANRAQGAVVLYKIYNLIGK
ncbi:S-layer homology domain-containing protein [Anaeromicrobium sediminis]|uniref:SLH domain-containing protein n=1 Tax=Anaeromicrobium sediminis TaxID=1478221 RepID=A0A267MC64_9FIRM|nr:S-layer homology domain-containing protein [Anaeromicrobium sediminis]PAB57139.1 hypothetical protein CCE28_19610 [Anaeromicrobium sediminis]